MFSGIWRQRSSAGMQSGGRNTGIAVMTMTKNAKTEKHTAGGLCGAYIKLPCKFEACRASISLDYLRFRSQK